MPKAVCSGSDMTENNAGSTVVGGRAEWKSRPAGAKVKVQSPLSLFLAGPRGRHHASPESGENRNHAHGGVDEELSPYIPSTSTRAYGYPHHRNARDLVFEVGGEVEAARDSLCPLLGSASQVP